MERSAWKELDDEREKDEIDVRSWGRRWGVVGGEVTECVDKRKAQDVSRSTS